MEAGVSHTLQYVRRAQIPPKRRSDTAHRREEIRAKRKSDTMDLEIRVKRKCDTMKKDYRLHNVDILNCPICLKLFSPPVYQCENGHSVCGDCIKMLQKGCPSCGKPVGSIRNLTTEKILDSLQVACRHAPHGCKKMVKINNRNFHEGKCEYWPFACPAEDCEYYGSTLTMPQHLTDEHQVRTLEIALGCGTLLFGMEPSEDFVMVKNRLHELFLLNRGSEYVGDQELVTFYCVSFGSQKRIYDLKVNLFSKSYSMSKVPALNIREWAMNGFTLAEIGDCLYFPVFSARKQDGYDILIGNFQSQDEDDLGRRKRVITSTLSEYIDTL